MNATDPRLGSLYWAQQTGGVLTWSQRLRLLRVIATTQTYAALKRIQPAKARPAHTRDLILIPPDSRFAREAERAAAEQPAALLAHSYRTWIYGQALAGLDGIGVDAEQLYAGSLLHDYGLTRPVSGEDFTLRSARRAKRAAEAAALEQHTIDELGEAIVAHTTPGVSVEHDGAVSFYIQAGALVDIAGLRLWDLPSELVTDTLRQYARDGFTAELAAMVKAEARAVPGGRFSLLHRCGFIAAMKLAPYERK